MRAAMGMLSGMLAVAAGLDPRPKAEDYAAQARTEKAAFGADYMVRSFSARNQTFLIDDYLVIEVAVYPVRRRPFLLAAGHFMLRVNGKKPLLAAQTPGMVAASLKYPDWERRPELVVGGGVGDAGVILGRRDPVERFPGDPRPRQTRWPAPPRVPEQASDAAKDSAPAPDELVVEAALPEGETSQPVAGYLYFAYRGKPKAIRTLELVYQGPAGDCVLRLM